MVFPADPRAPKGVNFSDKNGWASRNTMNVSVTKPNCKHSLPRSYLFHLCSLPTLWRVASTTFLGSGSPTATYLATARSLFRASSNRDIRNRIAISGGWDLPSLTCGSQGPGKLRFPVFSVA